MKSVKISLAFVFAVILTLTLATPTEAKIISSIEKNVIVTADEVIDDDLFISGENVTINGTVNGDVYVGAGVVDVNGVINGDVIAGGGMITVSGSVKDDVRAVAGQIMIKGAQIGDNVTVAAGTLNIDKDTSIGGTLTTAGGMVVMDAAVGRSLLGGAGTFILNGKVNGDLLVGTDSLTLARGSSVGGSVTYYSESDAVVSPEALIGGGIKKVSQDVSKGAASFTKSLSTGFKVFSFLSSLLVGFLLIYLLPRPVKMILSTIQKNPKGSIGWGLVILLITFPALFLLMITGVGIPLALILLVLFLIELYLAKIFVSLILGQFLLSNFNVSSGKNLQLIIGLISYYLLTSVPLVSGFVWLFTAIIALGGLFLYKRQVLGTRGG